MAVMIPPSPWLVRHLPQFPESGQILDLACGGGRHARWLAARGRNVLAADLEGDAWPLAGRQFAGVVVSNYLWRPRLADVCTLLAPGGVLIYETFMVGNEAYGKPSNPDFLLRPGELRTLAEAAGLRELAFQEGYADLPKPAMRQAICAVRE